MARPGPIDPGEANRLVMVQQLTPGVDTAGAPTDGATPGSAADPWTDLMALWMVKEPISGRERFAAGQTSAVYDSKWRTPHYVAELDPELVDVQRLRRIVYQGRAHDIVAADLVGQREGIELLTIARSAR